MSKLNQVMEEVLHEGPSEEKSPTEKKTEVGYNKGNKNVPKDLKGENMDNQNRGQNGGKNQYKNQNKNRSNNNPKPNSNDSARQNSDGLNTDILDAHYAELKRRSLNKLPKKVIRTKADKEEAQRFEEASKAQALADAQKLAKKMEKEAEKEQEKAAPKKAQEELAKAAPQKASEPEDAPKDASAEKYATIIINPKATGSVPSLKNVDGGGYSPVYKTPFLIGFSSSCDMQIRQPDLRNHTVSHEHAIISRDEQGNYLIKDISKNGTFIASKDKAENYVKLPPNMEIKLKDKTYIKFAEVVYFFETEGIKK